MSMHTTKKTWNEMVFFIGTLEDPACLSVNFKPEENEYAIWTGNQPYYFYDDEIEKLDNENRNLKKEIKRLNSIIDKLAAD
ncbi:TPA: hypothetical protein QCX89_002358 [Bacillus cereus]|uniref:hypothetical protein n=1 Tax=Bacillus cereus group sp. BfR-BA-01347 TaxID=2920310 RepID=UPI001F575CF4|nr:hypothetical protein [Bacillus cereus group sp. BfR-BA-01347]HDR7710393.1 hypothetical protein [Bacillus cereus]